MQSYYLLDNLNIIQTLLNSHLILSYGSIFQQFTYNLLENSTAFSILNVFFLIFKILFYCDYLKSVS